MNKEEELIDSKFKELKNKLIQELITQNQTLIHQLSENYGSFMNTNIPNLGISFNNKIVELQHEFEKKGVSFYVSHSRKEGALYDNLACSSFIGEAIRDSLYDICINAYNDIFFHINEIESALSNQNSELISLEVKKPIFSFFSKIWNHLFPSKKNNYQINSDILDKLSSIIVQFKESDNKIKEYNLDDNIVDSIVSYIVSKKYDPQWVPGIVEESVIPDFEKLGYTDLIPELQEKIITAYKRLLNEHPFKFYKLPDFNQKDEPANNSLDELIKEKEHLFSEDEFLARLVDDTDSRI